MKNKKEEYKSAPILAEQTISDRWAKIQFDKIERRKRFWKVVVKYTCAVFSGLMAITVGVFLAWAVCSAINILIDKCDTITSNLYL